MTTTAKPAKARERLTLRDSTDLLLAVDAWVDEHVDELELNGGALPDDLARLLDEIVAAREERAEAIVWKLDEFAGYAGSAKATKDRAARREKVWNNTIAAIKAYALRELERAGGAKLKTPSATLRIQTNSAPSTDVRFDDAQLLAFVDAGAHSLAPYLTVTRVVSIDRKALGAAHEARRAALEAHAATLELNDLMDAEGFAHVIQWPPERVDATRAHLRAAYVDSTLSSEFPGVVCLRGHHLRID